MTAEGGGREQGKRQRETYGQKERQTKTYIEEDSDTVPDIEIVSLPVYPCRYPSAAVTLSVSILL